MRKTAKTDPTAALAAIIRAGIPKTKQATAQAVSQARQRRPAGVDTPGGQQPEEHQDRQRGRRGRERPVSQRIVRCIHTSRLSRRRSPK